MSQPPSGAPDFSAPSFSGCYRHPDRATGISCQRCGRPICGECMNAASVGFQCPQCIGRGGSRAGGPKVREPRTIFGGALTNRAAPMTKIIMGVLAGVYVLDFVTRRLLSSLLILDNSAVLVGQYWRLVTYAFTSAGLLQVLMNLLVLWLAGRALEDLLGAWRLLALYVLAGIGGATLFFLIAGPGDGGYGSSAAVIGLLAANGVIKLKRREDIRPDIALLILLVLYSFVVGSGFFWAGQVGAILVGALTGFILAFAPRQQRTALQIAGMIVVAALCVVAVLVRSALI